MNGGLFEQHHVITLSKTDFINILNCPYIWYLKNVEKVRITPTDGMVEGYNLHSVMREINTNMKNIEEAKDYIASQIKKAKSFEKQLTNIINFLEVRESAGDSVFPDYSEVKIEVLLDDFKLVGVIDAIYKNDFGYEVFEYKKSFYKDDESLFLETSFYSYIFSEYTGNKVVRMGLFSFETGEVKYEFFDKDKILSRIKDSFEIILEGNFDPRPSYGNCRPCLYRGFCKYSALTNY